MPGAASRGCCSSERGGTALTQRGPAAATQGMLDRMDHRGLVLTALAWTLASACGSDGSVGPPSLVPLTSELHNAPQDRKSTRLNSSHSQISYAVFCLKKKTACRAIMIRLRA